MRTCVRAGFVWWLCWLVGSLFVWLVRFEGGASTGSSWVGMITSCNPRRDFYTKLQKDLCCQTPNPVLEHQIHFFLLWLLVSVLYHNQSWTYGAATPFAPWYTSVQRTGKTLKIQFAELNLYLPRPTIDNVNGYIAKKIAGIPTACDCFCWSNPIDATISSINSLPSACPL